MRSAVHRRACASRMQFTTQWRGLNCNAPMLFSLWPAPMYLTSSRATVFHRRAFVKDKYASAELHAYVRVYRKSMRQHTRRRVYA